MSDIFSSWKTQLTILEETAVLRKNDAQSLFKDDIRNLQQYLEKIEQRVKEVERSVEEEQREIASLDDKIAHANKQQLYLKSMETDFTIPARMTTSEDAPQSSRGAITQDELDELSPYMKGRLTVERINVALEELTSHANKNAVMIAAAKKNKTSGIDRKHALWLLHNISRNSSMKNRKYFVLESDLRRGRYLKMDNTSKSILTILRHVGRISECRLQADGKTHVVYVCLYM
jgi:chromosome segregation ATPase